MKSLEMPALTPQTWTQAYPWLAAACKRSQGELTMGELYRRLAVWPDYQLVLFDRGAAVLCRQDDALHIEALGGEFTDGWVDKFDWWLEQAAVAIGCTRSTLAGRKGWGRKLKRLGWVKNGEFLEVNYGRRRQQ